MAVGVAFAVVCLALVVLAWDAVRRYLVVYDRRADVLKRYEEAYEKLYRKVETIEGRNNAQALSARPR